MEVTHEGDRGAVMSKSPRENVLIGPAARSAGADVFSLHSSGAESACSGQVPHIHGTDRDPCRIGWE
jgi:hypothetical protein